MVTNIFRRPVTVFSEESRRFHIIATVSDASDFLFDHWTENDSELWMRALDACAGALRGLTKTEEAHRAFAEAVHEAGINTARTGMRHR